MTAYRRELGIGAEPVVLYAGNIGFSQSVGLLLDAARRLPDVTFLVNGEGVGRDALIRAADGLTNVRFAGYVPEARLPELLATGDIHAVPLKRGLAAVSVPSKTYSILAAGRPVVASVDEGSEVQRIIETAGAGVAVPPEDERAFVSALLDLADDSGRREQMEKAARVFVESAASPRAVAEAYQSLFASLARRDSADVVHDHERNSDPMP